MYRWLILLSTISSLYASDYFLDLYVDARHLNYESAQSLLRSIEKTQYFGHAWIYVQGLDANNEPIYIEGGHSGELGLFQPKYVDGVWENIEVGCTDPIRYLWEPQCDGFFQWGSGGHRPTSAVRFDLTKEQFNSILEFIYSYPYRNYSIVGNQCVSFVCQVAMLAGAQLNATKTISIEQYVKFHGRSYKLWTHPTYSTITIYSPDALEEELKDLK
jgi:hypothetical protein